MLDQKALIIDNFGKIISKTPYFIQEGYNSENYMAIITDKPTHLGNVKYGLITNNGEIIKPKFDTLPSNLFGYTLFYNDTYSSNLNNRDTYILMKNNQLVNFKGSIQAVSEGTIMFTYDDSPENSKLARSNAQRRFGFITPNAKIITGYKNASSTEYKFLDALAFSDGMAAVAINTTASKAKFYDSWNYLKIDGTLLNCNYAAAGSFSDGIAPIRSGSYYGYIDKNLNMIIRPKEVKVATNINPSYSNISYLTSLSQEEYDYVIKKSKEIISTIIKPNMNDRQKLDAVYKYVTKNVNYDSENFAADNIPRVSYSIYGALKYNICVCEGYAELVDFLLLLSGVDSIIAVGSIIDSGIGHAWNIVKIDGSYYHVDATWDEGKDSNQWYFYLRNDDFMLQNRTWQIGSYPKCDKDLNTNLKFSK